MLTTILKDTYSYFSEMFIETEDKILIYTIIFSLCNKNKQLNYAVSNACLFAILQFWPSVIFFYY